MSRFTRKIAAGAAAALLGLLGTAVAPAGASVNSGPSGPSVASSNSGPSRAVTASEQQAMRNTPIERVEDDAVPMAVPREHGHGGGRSPGSHQGPNGPELKVPGQLAPSTVGSAVTPVASGGVGATSGVNAPKWPGAYNANPNKQVGKLFFYDPVHARDSWCSATAVTSGNKSSIITAGHCVWNPDPDGNSVVGTNGVWMTNLRFCPGYEYSCKLGTWTARYIATTPTWFSGYGSAHAYDFRDDVALVLLNKDASGRFLTDAVGSQGVWFNGPTNVWRTALGYPASDTRFPGYVYDAEDLIYCQNNDTADSTYIGTMWMPCTMTGGASGGPWLSWVNGSTWLGYVNSVNSHKPWGGPYMNGPFFDAAESTLYSTWNTK